MEKEAPESLAGEVLTKTESVTGFSVCLDEESESFLNAFSLGNVLAEVALCDKVKKVAAWLIFCPSGDNLLPRFELWLKIESNASFRGGGEEGAKTLAKEWEKSIHFSELNAQIKTITRFTDDPEKFKKTLFGINSN